jgi:hypothetical protein
MHDLGWNGKEARDSTKGRVEVGSERKAWLRSWHTPPQKPASDVVFMVRFRDSLPRRRLAPPSRLSGRRPLNFRAYTLI